MYCDHCHSKYNITMERAHGWKLCLLVYRKDNSYLLFYKFSVNLPHDANGYNV